MRGAGRTSCSLTLLSKYSLRYVLHRLRMGGAGLVAPKLRQNFRRKTPNVPFSHFSRYPAIAEDRREVIGLELVPQRADAPHTGLRRAVYMRRRRVIQHHLGVHLLKHRAHLGVMLVAVDTRVVAARDSIMLVRHLPVPAEKLARQHPRLLVGITHYHPGCDDRRHRLAPHQVAVEGVISLDLAPR